MQDRRTMSSFLYLLKNKELIDNYNFFFDFDASNNKEGKLIIGSFPDELYNNNLKRNDLYYSTSEKGFFYYNIRFNKIYITDNNTLIYNIEDKDCELDFDHDAIMADTYYYKKILEDYLQDLINEQKCFSSEFSGCADFYETIKQDISFFYCKNVGNIIEELKKRILPIKLFTHEYNNYTFEINSDDILVKKGDYIFIKIVFPAFSYTWTLGKPFSLKYKFIFNPDIRKIGFYVNSKNKDEIGKRNNKILKYFLCILLIIVLIAIFVIVGIILGKKLYGLKRKKRANEMDDEYEYFEGKIKKEFENGDKKSGMNYDIIN